MSDSGKQIGNCKHGRTAAFCCDCKDAEIYALRMHVKRLDIFIEKIISNRRLNGGMEREARQLLKETP